MKKLIYQYVNPISTISEKGIQSVSKYSKLILSDHIVYNKDIVLDEIKPGNYWGVFYPFLYDLETVLKYDKICYLDTDILATTNLNDIFNNEGYISGCHNYASMRRNIETEGHDEYSHFDISEYDEKHRKVFQSLTDIAGYNSRGINSGVVLFDAKIFKNFSEWLLDNKTYLLGIEKNEPILWKELGKYDQTIINIFIAQYRKNITNLNDIFNWRLNRCNYDNRWIASLIHYIMPRNKPLLLDDFKNDKVLK